MISTTDISIAKDYAKWLRNSAPYINAHRGKTFVLMFGGDAVEHPNFSNIIRDIALLNSLGVKLVLVHRARPQIESRCKLRGITRQPVAAPTDSSEAELSDTNRRPYQSGNRHTDVAVELITEVRSAGAPLELGNL